MHYENFLSGFFLHSFLFLFFWVLGETRPRLCSHKEVPFCGALGPSLVLLAQHFCFFSKPMLIIVCILGFFLYVLCSFSCMFNRLLVHFTSGSSTQLSVLVVVLKFSQCMCVSVYAKYKYN